MCFFVHVWCVVTYEGFLKKLPRPEKILINDESKFVRKSTLPINFSNGYNFVGNVRKCQYFQWKFAMD